MLLLSHPSPAHLTLVALEEPHSAGLTNLTYGDKGLALFRNLVPSSPLLFVSWECRDMFYLPSRCAGLQNKAWLNLVAYVHSIRSLAAELTA